MSRPRLSIVLCTRDRATLLADCLHTVLADRSRVARELVVVDNGSTDSTAELVRAVAREAPFPVRLVQEPRPGKTPALNAGVRAARGAIVLFTDDDVAVEDGWADAIAAGFDEPDVVVVSGRIRARWPTEPPPWLNGPQATMLTTVDLGDEPRDLGPNEFPPGANFAARADALRRLDPPFHPRLGHIGRVRVGQDEMYVVNRLRAFGRVVHRPAAVVSLWVDVDRLDLGWMRAAYFQLGVGLGRRGRIEHFPFPSPARRAVRAARLLRLARGRTRANERRPRQGPETWEELWAYMWAGLHVEMLVGRSRRLSDWIARAVG